MVSQNSRSRATRPRGGLPAISAELIAPIEMPATQSEVQIVLGQRLIDPRLVGAERAAALEHQGNLLELFVLAVVGIAVDRGHVVHGGAPAQSRR